MAGGSAQTHRVDRVGAATSELLDGARLVTFDVRWMNRHLATHRA